MGSWGRHASHRASWPRTTKTLFFMHGRSGGCSAVLVQCPWYLITGIWFGKSMAWKMFLFLVNVLTYFWHHCLMIWGRLRQWSSLTTRCHDNQTRLKSHRVRTFHSAILTHFDWAELDIHTQTPTTPQLHELSKFQDQPSSVSCFGRHGLLFEAATSSIGKPPLVPRVKSERINIS